MLLGGVGRVKENAAEVNTGCNALGGWGGGCQQRRSPSGGWAVGQPEMLNHPGGK